MDNLQKLALAGLVHDLPTLFSDAQLELNDFGKSILALSYLEDSLRQVIDQAEAYALSGGEKNAVVQKKPLRSIFSLVRLHSPTLPPQVFYSFSSLNSTKESHTHWFPKPENDMAGFDAHVQNLAHEIEWLGEHVGLENFELVYAHLMAIIQKYGWCLPAHSQDISFYDHARLTSAIANCLYLFASSNGEISNLSEDEEVFGLVVGDFSGIQKYIFDITSTGAGGVARRLRARSFYVSLLSESVSHQVVFHLGVPLGNIIMGSGGKFYVLAPNLDLKRKIATLREEVDSWFRDEFNGEISINLAFQSFTGKLFRAGNLSQKGFGDVLTELGSKLGREKRRKGYGVLIEDGHWREESFVKERDFWGVGICPSCNKFPGQRAGGICEQCERDGLLGQKLPTVSYVAFYNHPGEEENSLPMGRMFAAQVFREHELQDIGRPYLLVKLNDPNVRQFSQYPISFRYLANHVPTAQHGIPVNFEEIAQSAEGRPLLGYIKADVDYLGLLFAQGLRDDEVGADTAAHIAALSRELDLFFSGWLQHILSRKKDYQQFYTIFSGGDDLFLVGPWDQAAALAQEINQEFRRFVGENPNITLSAGILFTKDRYPISRAAVDAEQVLEKAKEKRNQLSLLGDALQWNEFPEVFAEVDMLRKRLEYLNSAFLYRLVEYANLYKKWKVENDIEGLRFKPLFAYNIARNLRKGDQELYRWADGLMQLLNDNPEHQKMKHLGLVATYLLFAKRGRSRG